MITWLVNNLATILISLALLGIVIAIIRSMVRGKKKGSSSCGCPSAGCGACSAGCHACSGTIKIRAQKGDL